MGKSLCLRLVDVRAVYRLVGECRELGDDPIAWRTRLVVGVLRLVGARVGMCGEIVLADAYYTLPQVEVGWEPWQSAICHDYWREHLDQDDLLWERVGKKDGFLQTITRQQYVSDDEWYDLPQVRETLAPAQVDDLIMSGRMCTMDEPRLDRLTVFRGWREKPFGEHERLLVQLLHDEIVPRIGFQLAASDEPGPAGLSPRKREVLECLLEGDSDQQIAARLRISKATVSEYASTIFRHFRVSSRSELLAYFLRRFRRRRR
jgi:DNA-binding CsgD family transcriptional regulator